jgi:phosphoribosyl 1,2-cyclic phosphodiesterase
MYDFHIITAMPIYFQSIRSGSSGNAVLLGNAQTRILFDFGVRTKRESREILKTIDDQYGHVSAAVISHLHSDHLSFYGRMALAEQAIAIHLPRETALHFNGQPPPLAFWYDHAPFRIASFDIHPVKVRHAPSHPTYGFIVSAEVAGHRSHKICVFTDLCRWTEEMVEYLSDCDFAYLEANHDKELLRLHPNYASRYHLSNPHTGLWIRTALRRSRIRPKAIMLGHLSAERNRPELALHTIRQMLKLDDFSDLTLLIAPRFEASQPVVIAE